MKIIRMYSGNTELAKITDGKFEQIIESKSRFSPNFQEWYDCCFFDSNATTFDERFELVKQSNYFCYMKPSVRLIAEEI